MGLVEVTPLSGTTVECDTDNLMRLASERDAAGVGHLEVALVGSRYPMLTVFFKNSPAVVLRIDQDGGEVIVAEGDGSIPASQSAEFFGPVGVEHFTGEVILDDSRARELLRAFADQHQWPLGTRWRIE
jgi:hypothetical protein